VDRDFVIDLCDKVEELIDDDTLGKDSLKHYDGNFWVLTSHKFSSIDDNVNC